MSEKKLCEIIKNNKKATNKEQKDYNKENKIDCNLNVIKEDIRDILFESYTNFIKGTKIDLEGCTKRITLYSKMSSPMKNLILLKDIIDQSSIIINILLKHFLKVPEISDNFTENSEEKNQSNPNKDKSELINNKTSNNIPIKKDEDNNVKDKNKSNNVGSINKSTEISKKSIKISNNPEIINSIKEQLSSIAKLLNGINVSFYEVSKIFSAPVNLVNSLYSMNIDLITLQKEIINEELLQNDFIKFIRERSDNQFLLKFEQEKKFVSGEKLKVRNQIIKEMKKIYKTKLHEKKRKLIEEIMEHVSGLPCYFDGEFYAIGKVSISSDEDDCGIKSLEALESEEEGDNENGEEDDNENDDALIEKTVVISANKKVIKFKRSKNEDKNKGKNNENIINEHLEVNIIGKASKDKIKGQVKIITEYGEDKDKKRKIKEKIKNGKEEDMKENIFKVENKNNNSNNSNCSLKVNEIIISDINNELINNESKDNINNNNNKKKKKHRKKKKKNKRKFSSELDNNSRETTATLNDDNKKDNVNNLENKINLKDDIDEAKEDIKFYSIDAKNITKKKSKVSEKWLKSLCSK